MLIKCENCSVVYEVPDERLNLEHPHFFKCSACGSVFAVPVDKKADEPTEEVLEQVPEEISEIPAVEQSDSVPMPLSDIFTPDESESTETPEQSDSEKEDSLFEPLDTAEEFTPVSQRLSGNSRFWWFFTSLIIAFVAIFSLFYVGRYFFIRKIPATEQIYQNVGIRTEVLGEGLAFQDTVFDIQKNNDKYGLQIKTQIVNTTDQAKIVPNVVVHLLDENDEVIQEGHINLPKGMLDAGQTLPVETYLKSLSEDAKRIEITFERTSN